MTRREMTKALGWSNDKITARLNLRLDSLPVLTKGENGAPDQYSAMCVYRWLLRQEWERHPAHDSQVHDWFDAKRFGDVCINNPRIGRCPSRIAFYEYKEIRPELFAEAA